MALLLPFVFNVDPASAMALLLGAHVATVYNTGITSILFGIPGASKTVSLTFDGYPMTQRGQGVRALRATAVSAVVGGFIGIGFLALAMPLLLLVMLKIAQPEYFVLGLWALTLIALFSEGNVFKGVASGGLGLLLSFIGVDPISSEPRYTFGSLHLYDGLDLAVVFIGLFAVSQMIDLYKGGKSISGKIEPIRDPEGDSFLSGFSVCLHNKALLLRASLLGVFIGVMPGVGATLGGLASYGQAVQTTRNPEPKFGKGNVRGVIAPAATVGSNEGSELLPTLGLGIPGGESSAILLSALLTLGVPAGPTFMDEHADIYYSIIWVVVAAFVLASFAGYLTAPLFARITSVSPGKLVPMILIVCFAGAYAIQGHLFDVFVAAILGVVGYFLKRADYSLGAIAVGLVLGQLLERWLHVSIDAYGGWFLFTRPITLVLLILATISTGLTIFRGSWRKHAVVPVVADGRENMGADELVEADDASARAKE